MEIELKLLLGPDDFERLRARLGPAREIVRQTNHYFDTEDRRLGRSGWGLRLRDEDAATGRRAWLTLKQGGQETDDFSVRPEYDRRLDPAELERLVGDRQALAAAARELAGEPVPLPESGSLVELGRLVNHRHRHPMPGHEDRVVELDHTIWPDGTESHELELEVDALGQIESARAQLRRLFEELGIEWQPGHESKLARLVAMLDRG